MKNAKVISAKRSFFMSVLSLILCFAMLLGTTYAWFTDEVTSGVNKIVAGNLDIEVEYSKTGDTNDWHDLQGSSSLFTGALWEPGHTEYVYLRVKNAGTLALKYDLKVSPISETGGINQAGNSFKLSDYIKFATTAGNDTLTTYADRAAARAAVDGAGVTLTSGMGQAGQMLPGENSYNYLTLVVYMPEDVGNVANYKTGTTAPEIDLGITVLATQLKSENDSFGDTYDDGLTNDTSVIYNYFPQVNVTGQLEIDENAKISKGSEAAGTVTVTQLEVGESEAPKSRVVMSSSEKIEGTSAAKLETIVQKAEGGQQTGSMTLKVVKDDTENATFKTDSNKIDTATQDSTTYQVTVETEGVVAVPEYDNMAKFKVDLLIGKNRTNVKMYHNSNPMKTTGDEDYVAGAPETFTYNADTGYVTMYVDTFSPFTAVYDMPVAAIGTTVYYTLKSAIDAAQANDTVILIKDVSLNTKLNISDKKITLDGAGYTISASADFTPQDSMIGVTAYSNNAGFVMKNVTLTGNDKTKYTLNLFKATDFVLENVISSANNYGSLLINSSTGTIKGKATNIPALEVYTNTASSGLPSDLTVMDGTYMYANVYTKDDSSAPAKLTITGGTFTGMEYFDTKFCVIASKNGTISITGGTYDTDPGAYVAEGYAARKSGSKWIVGAAITIGDTGYSSLEAAVAAAKSGDIISVAAGRYQLTESVVLPSGVKLVGEQAGTPGKTWATDDAAKKSVIVAPSTGDRVIQILQGEGVDIGNVVIDGIMIDCEHRSVKGIFVKKTAGSAMKGIVIQNCAVIHSGNDAIDVCNTDGAVIDNNYIYDFVDNGISLGNYKNQEGRTAFIRNNFVSTASGTENGAIAVTAGLGNVQVLNNTIENITAKNRYSKICTKESAISVYDVNEGGTVLLSGNTITDSNQGIGIHKFSALSAADSVIVQNNTVSGFTSFGYASTRLNDAGKSAVTVVTITGNTFTGAVAPSLAIYDLRSDHYDGNTENQLWQEVITGSSNTYNNSIITDTVYQSQAMTAK